GAEVAPSVPGPPLSTYTGTLLADTAIPVWHEARRELPWLFGASASASAGAATALFLPPAEAGPARRLAIGGVLGELGWLQVMRRRLGFVGEVYDQGEAGRFAKLSKASVAAGRGQDGCTGASSSPTSSSERYSRSGSDSSSRAASASSRLA